MDRYKETMLKVGHNSEFHKNQDMNHCYYRLNKVLYQTNSYFLQDTNLRQILSWQNPQSPFCCYFNVLLLPIEQQNIITVTRLLILIIQSIQAHL